MGRPACALRQRRGPNFLHLLTLHTFRVSTLVSILVSSSSFALWYFLRTPNGKPLQAAKRQAFASRESAANHNLCHGRSSLGKQQQPSSQRRHTKQPRSAFHQQPIRMFLLNVCYRATAFGGKSGSKSGRQQPCSFQALDNQPPSSPTPSPPVGASTMSSQRISTSIDSRCSTAAASRPSRMGAPARTCETAREADSRP